MQFDLQPCHTAQAPPDSFTDVTGLSSRSYAGLKGKGCREVIITRERKRAKAIPVCLCLIAISLDGMCGRT